MTAIEGDYPTSVYIGPGGASLPENVMWDAAPPGGGWSKGNGITLPLSTQNNGDNFEGQLLGLSIRYSANLLAPNNTPAPFGGLYGSLYSGIFLKAPAYGASGWTSFPKDTGFIYKMWDGSTDEPFPFVYGQDVRNFSMQFPEPIPIHKQDSFYTGIWSSPIIGNPSLTQGFAPSARGMGILISSASYSLQVTGESGVPSL